MSGIALKGQLALAKQVLETRGDPTKVRPEDQIDTLNKRTRSGRPGRLEIEEKTKNGKPTFALVHHRPKQGKESKKKDPKDDQPKQGKESKKKDPKDDQPKLEYPDKKMLKERDDKREVSIPNQPLQTIRPRISVESFHTDSDIRASQVSAPREESTRQKSESGAPKSERPNRKAPTERDDSRSHRSRRDESPSAQTVQQSDSGRSHRSRRDESPSAQTVQQSDSGRSHRSRRDESPSAQTVQQSDSGRSHRSRRDESPSAQTVQQSDSGRSHRSRRDKSLSGQTDITDRTVEESDAGRSRGSSKYERALNNGKSETDREEENRKREFAKAIRRKNAAYENSEDGYEGSVSSAASSYADAKSKVSNPRESRRGETVDNKYKTPQSSRIPPGAKKDSSKQAELPVRKKREDPEKRESKPRASESEATYTRKSSKADGTSSHRRGRDTESQASFETAYEG